MEDKKERREKNYKCEWWSTLNTMELAELVSMVKPYGQEDFIRQGVMVESFQCRRRKENKKKRR